MSGPCLSIKVEVSPGADIKDACSEAAVLAARTQLRVEFDFNGVRCVMNPGGVEEDLMAEWHRLLGMAEKDRGYRSAIAHCGGNKTRYASPQEEPHD